MRLIKFRFWDKRIRKMSRPLALGIIYENLNEYFRSQGASDYCVDWNDIVKMQYTGLKDKNGKEIFEGDVLVYERFAQSCSGTAKTKVEIPSIYLMRSGMKNLEVIGNVHENPDLL
jgi:uncharacterized phage protein (TIGR01671 family)